MLHNIRELDFDQVRKVLKKEVRGRRCGNTTAKMLLMLSHALNNYDVHSHFLFIGENNRHVEDIQKFFASWVEQLNFTVIHCSLGGGVIKTQFDGRLIDFRFLYAGENLACQVRGYRINETIADLTWEATARHHRELEELEHILMRTIIT